MKAVLALRLYAAALFLRVYAGYLNAGGVPTASFSELSNDTARRLSVAPAARSSFTVLFRNSISATAGLW